MEVSYLLYLLVGKVLIFFGMKFAEDNEVKNNFIKNLLSCSLCWGFWAYGITSFAMGEVLFSDYYYFPIFSQLVTGGISSLLVFLLETGWKSYFGVIVIE